MNDHSLGECVEGTEGIRRLGSIRFGDLLVGCDSNGKPSSGEETRMHYAHRRRVKIWGEAQVVENERRVDSEAANCSQHIPQRFEAADVEAALAERDRRIAVLEAEIKRLR